MHTHLHIKTDGRELFLYSQNRRTYQITNDLEPLDTPPTPHMRWHPLRREWVLYNAGRNDRTFHPPADYNPLAPVAVHGFPGEIPTPDFEIAVFENRWPGLSMDVSGVDLGLGVATPGALGRCDVVVYGTNVDDRLYDFSDRHVAMLLEVWAHRYESLIDDPRIEYVMPFESRGKFVGVTLPHPHGQVYAFNFLPPVIERQAIAERQDAVLASMVEGGAGADRHAYILSGYAAETSRILCPKFGRYPYETWVMPPRNVSSPGALTPAERLDMARALKQTVKALDTLFNAMMPFCMWVSFPPKGFEDDWPFHIQIWPMQRSEDKMKYLASVEQLSHVFLVDVLPEQAAERLGAILSTFGDEA